MLPVGAVGLARGGEGIGESLACPFSAGGLYGALHGSRGGLDTERLFEVGEGEGACDLAIRLGGESRLHNEGFKFAGRAEGERPDGFGRRRKQGADGVEDTAGFTAVGSPQVATTTRAWGAATRGASRSAAMGSAANWTALNDVTTSKERTSAVANPAKPFPNRTAGLFVM